MQSREPLFIFVFAFALNFIWEELHSVLYVSYQGGAVTNLILLRAAVFDAAVIALFACPLLKSDLNNRGGLTSLTLFVGTLTLFAIFLERWALGTGRWVYADAMPLLPLLRIGLTPTIQLGITGLISLKISRRLNSRAD